MGWFLAVIADRSISRLSLLAFLLFFWLSCPAVLLARVLSHDDVCPQRITTLRLQDPSDAFVRSSWQIVARFIGLWKSYRHHNSTGNRHVWCGCVGRV
eukprot:12927104-Prorocentrum_lima.AAC.1